MNTLVFSNFTLDDLKSVISESISNELQKFRPQQPDQQDDQLLKIGDIAKMLHVSNVTVFAWKKAGKIPFHRISRKIYFKKNEVMDALKKIERKGF